LFRQGAEGRIREHVLSADFVEAVIGLAPNLFYGTGLAACVLILRQRKADHRKGKVLFINGERLFTRGRNRNTLEPEHAATLFKTYETFGDEPGLAARCETCGGELVARSDDSENVVRNRLKLYWRETQPMIAHYHARPTYRVVDGMQEPERVRDALVAAVASALGKGPGDLPRGNMWRPGPTA
jgi:hypothetical protein